MLWDEYERLYCAWAEHERLNSRAGGRRQAQKARHGEGPGSWRHRSPWQLQPGDSKGDHWSVRHVRRLITLSCRPFGGYEDTASGELLCRCPRDLHCTVRHDNQWNHWEGEFHITHHSNFSIKMVPGCFLQFDHLILKRNINGFFQPLVKKVFFHFPVISNADDCFQYLARKLKCDGFSWAKLILEFGRYTSKNSCVNPVSSFGVWSFNGKIRQLCFFQHIQKGFSSFLT